MIERTGPVSTEYYKPIERPTRYPLMLESSCCNEAYQISLWWEDGTSKMVIAIWHKDKEGYDLKFVGDRPLDKRVNWKHFGELVEQGQRICDRMFLDGEEEDWD